MSCVNGAASGLHLGVRVRAIVTLDDVLAYLENTGEHAEHLDAMRAYRDEYGARTP